MMSILNIFQSHILVLYIWLQWMNKIQSQELVVM